MRRVVPAGGVGGTPISIAQLAAFALVVVGIGTGAGILLHAGLASRQR